MADNLNPNLPEFERHKAALTEAFVAHMGGEVVDAALLRWSDAEPDTDDPTLAFHGKIEDDDEDPANDT